MIADDWEANPAGRPWGLRGLCTAPSPAAVPAYRYDDGLQVAVMDDGRPWVESEAAKEWSSVAELDGDEGRSETYGWDDGRDVTEGV
jgi:putative ATP-grasp target RiPP